MLVVPRDAVVLEGEQAYVLVQRGGRFERQDVGVGAVGATDAVVDAAASRKASPSRATPRRCSTRPGGRADGRRAEVPRTLIAVVVIAVVDRRRGGRDERPSAAAIPNVTTVDVTHGDFVDYIQIRGDIRPAKSIVLAAPLQSGGDLQITKLVKNGATVKKGDIVVEFDATTLQQRLAERRSDLKSAEGEIDAGPGAAEDQRRGAQDGADEGASTTSSERSSISASAI